MAPFPDPPRDPKYAWRELSRAEPPKRSVQDRVGDFGGVYEPYDEWIASEQASRCIQCPNPSCVEACPLGVPVPDLLQLTADGRYLEAANLLFSHQSMPELFVHVCAGERLCEAACLVGARSDPVPIGAIGRFLLDYAWRHGVAEPPREPPTGQRVAIIGAGLCGLVCADDLSRDGHTVTVFDSYAKPGGRLVNSLPGFRVDRTLIEKRVRLLRERGVTFQMQVTCGREVTLDSLRRDHDVVLFALGRAEPTPLAIPGAGLRGVYQAYPFVLQHTADAPIDSPRVDVHERSVVVSGGGDTAIDAVRVAVRCGARHATCLYRRGEPEMPGSPTGYADALEEGGAFQCFTEPIAVLGNAAGEVTHVRCRRTQAGPPDGSGRPSVVAVPGTEFDLPCDVFLVAHGFAAPKLESCDAFGQLARDEHGFLRVDAEQMTSVPGVFAAGSIVRGSIPLVDAVRDARRAAAAVARYLGARGAPGGGNRAA